MQPNHHTPFLTVIYLKQPKGHKTPPANPPKPARPISQEQILRQVRLQMGAWVQLN
jgi:hypothetical protein